MTKHTRIIMGMPVILHLPTATSSELVEAVFERLIEIDRSYSPYKESSEVSRFRDGKLFKQGLSDELQSIFDLAEEAKSKTDGYFDIVRNGVVDPTGIVKGWAIDQAAQIIKDAGIRDFMVDIAGDMVCSGFNSVGEPWFVGIRAPHEPSKVVKTLHLTDMSIATSGTTERGQHIYNPKLDAPIEDVLSISVIGPEIIWADVYATAAFAMGRAGIEWLEGLDEYEGFAILPDMTGISTSGLDRYLD